MIKKLYLFAFAAVLMTACNNGGKFTLSGNIKNAEGKVVYFEKTGLVKDSLIDSVKLTSGGAFKFKSHRQKYPDLYRLRLDSGRQFIVVVDSTEKIEIQGDYDDLINAAVKGSPETETVQKLRKSLISLQQEFDKITTEKDGAKSKIMLDSFLIHIEKHKNIVKGIALSNPSSMASYYALYQQIGGNYVFSPYDKQDRPYFQAVATSFNMFMPEFDRSKNLYNMVLAALKEERLARKQSTIEKLSDSEKVGFIDIVLNDNNGYPKKLSSLKGNVVVIDFSIFATDDKDNYTNYIFSLRELYNKYNKQGMEIYQVSLDENKMFWQQSVSNLPWVCVNDDTGRNAQIYNVQQVPTLFLIDRQENIIGRFTNIKQLEAALIKVL